jgi:hypothetical protein
MSRITGSEVANLMEAYNAVYAPQINEDQIQENFEIWMDSLVEEGYDLSKFTWEEMYEEYITEIGVNLGGQKAVDAVKARSAQQQQSAARLDTLRAQRFGAGSYRTASPTPTAKAAPTPAAKPAVSGLSAADRSAYSNGGGNAKAQQGMSTAQVIAQGKANLARMDQGKSAPAKPAPAAAAKPAAAPATASKPAPAATPAAKAAPAAAAPSTAATGFKLAQQGVNLAAPAAPKKPSLASGIDDIKAMQAASRQRQGLTQSFDPFDVVLGHLIDEGYADTEESATAIMANMSEEWRQSILDEGDNYDKNRKRAAQRAAARNAARDAGQTGAVPGVGYVTPRRERETYRDAAGTERHKTGARMPEKKD